MATRTEAVTQSLAWLALEAHYRAIRDTHLRALFADDPKRGEQMTAEAAGIYFDYSKNRATKETLRLLFDLAEARPARAYRCHVSGREDQRIGTAGRSACGVARPERRILPC